MKIQNNKTKTATTILASLVIGLVVMSPTTILPNVSATVHYPPQPPPQLSSSENQTIIATAMAVPGLQNWSHGWKYVLMGFGSNNGKLGTPDFKWQYASVVLKAPSSSAPVACSNDWRATVVIDITTMKVVSATYPTMESHPCQLITGGGPRANILDFNNTTFSYIPSKIESPLKQIQSGIAANNVICSEDLQLIIKMKDGSPACVTSETASMLTERGWAKPVQ